LVSELESIVHYGMLSKENYPHSTGISLGYYFILEIVNGITDICVLIGKFLRALLYYK